MAGLRFAALRIRKECLPKRMLPYNWFMPENKPSDSDPARAQQPPKFLRYTSSHAPKPAPLNPSELPPVPTLPEQGLESFRSQFHDLMGKRTAKPRAGFNDEVMGLCDQTGRFVHRLIEKKNLCWPELPQVFLSGPPHEPLPVEVVAEIALTDAVERNSPYFDVWWHGLLDWIAEQIEEPTFIPDSRIAKYLQMARIHLEPPAIDLDSPAKKVLNILAISNPDVTWPLICEASVPALAYLLRVLRSSSTGLQCDETPASAPTEQPAPQTILRSGTSDFRDVAGPLAECLRRQKKDKGKGLKIGAVTCLRAMRTPGTAVRLDGNYSGLRTFIRDDVPAEFWKCFETSRKPPILTYHPDGFDRR